MKYVNRFPELCHVHRTVRPTRVVRSNLPDGFREAAQHLRTFMPLPDLRLVDRESELLSNRGWKVCQPIKRIDKPNQLPRSFRVFRHHTHCMPELV
jgi:hypothetical protein